VSTSMRGREGARGETINSRDLEKRTPTHNEEKGREKSKIAQELKRSKKLPKHGAKKESPAESPRGNPGTLECQPPQENGKQIS